MRQVGAIEAFSLSSLAHAKVCNTLTINQLGKQFVASDANASGHTRTPYKCVDCRGGVTLAFSQRFVCLQSKLRPGFLVSNSGRAIRLACCVRPCSMKALQGPEASVLALFTADQLGEGK